MLGETVFNFTEKEEGTVKSSLITSEEKIKEQQDQKENKGQS